MFHVKYWRNTQPDELNSDRDGWQGKNAQQAH